MCNISFFCIYRAVQEEILLLSDIDFEIISSSSFSQTAITDEVLLSANACFVSAKVDGASLKWKMEDYASSQSQIQQSTILGWYQNDLDSSQIGR